jgi:hypothetical protein
MNQIVHMEADRGQERKDKKKTNQMRWQICPTPTIPTSTCGGAKGRHLSCNLDSSIAFLFMSGHSLLRIAMASCLSAMIRAFSAGEISIVRWPELACSMVL